jgi:hypothetical protein
MSEEVINTLKTLDCSYQNEPRDSYEVLVMENPSDNNLKNHDFSIYNAEIKYFYNNENLPLTSAINNLSEKASGDYLIIIPDGARLLSKRVLHYCKQAINIDKKSIVAFHGFHLGLFPQQFSVEQKLYSKADEVSFLKSIDFPNNPDSLFLNASWAGSSNRGSFFEMAESNCLMLPKDLWLRVAGFDERLDIPSGGIANLDLYGRVISNFDHKLFFVLGEGCFHQLHGGDTTSSNEKKFNKYKLDYKEKTGKEWRFVKRDDYEFLGRVPPQFLGLLKDSISKTIHARQRERPYRIQRNIGAAMQFKKSVELSGTSFIFVLAMHRSKSSYVTRKIYESSNSIIPGTILGGTSKSNPGGHYEPHEICVFHNNVLNEMKLSWRSISDIEIQDEAFLDWRSKQLEKIICWGVDKNSKDNTQISLLIKDPRIVRLWPIWNRFLKKGNRISKKILLLDHPQKIAQSLYKRNAINPDLSKLLWARYTLDGLNAMEEEDLVLDMYSSDRSNIKHRLDEFFGCEIDLDDYIESDIFEPECDIDTAFMNFVNTGNFENFKSALHEELSFIKKYRSLFAQLDFYYSNQFI